MASDMGVEAIRVNLNVLRKTRTASFQPIVTNTVIVLVPSVLMFVVNRGRVVDNLATNTIGN